MRILCVDGPYFLDALARLGHQTLSVGSSPGVDVRLDSPMSLAALMETLGSRGFAPDAAVWADTCQPPTVAGLETLPCPTVAYSIDQYMNPWHLAYSAGFDLALVAQKDYLPLFSAEHPRPAAWMPLFCDPVRDADLGLARDIPVSFVGTLDSPANPERGPFLAAFRRKAPLAALTGDFRPVFARSRIVLNQSAAGELNFRLFQAAACGAAVLTEDAGNGLRELFTPGEDILIYPRGDAGAAARAALSALGDPGLESLARSGREKAVSQHGVDSRAARLCHLIEGLLARQAQRERLVRLDEVRRRTAYAYSILALDQALPLPGEHRRFYLELAFKTNPDGPGAVGSGPC
jgi:hypothetical protein